MYSSWKPYVPVAQRRKEAAREMAKLAKKGHVASPVVITGRAIASTYWGKSWCENLERYGDLANRIPRGRTYVRNGSVVDLQVSPGEVRARVQGSSLYDVTIRVAPVGKPHWDALCRESAGAIDSLVELLQGRFAKGVMERLCQQRVGLFPTPAELTFTCDCPDAASMCKHIAAVFYGIGARLDAEPALLFVLRKVDANELVVRAARALPLQTGPQKGNTTSKRLLEGDGLAALFGLDLGEISESTEEAAPAKGPAPLKSRVKAASTEPSAAEVSRPAAPLGPDGRPTLPDLLCPTPRLLIVGLNPGARSAQIGHYYGHGGNRFWKLMSESGLFAGAFARPLGPEDDARLPALGVAMTDLVKRSTSGIDTIEGHEWREGGERLRALIAELQPAHVAFVGLAGYRMAYDKRAKAGLQPQPLEGAQAWVLPSTSGRSTIPYATQLALWQGLARAVGALR